MLPHDPERWHAAQRAAALDHAVAETAHDVADALAGAAATTDAVAVGWGGPERIGAAAVALQHLSKQVKVAAQQFRAFADALRDIHDDALRDRFADLPTDYITDLLAGVPRPDEPADDLLDDRLGDHDRADALPD
jgi:hypothetical protein